MQPVRRRALLGAAYLGTFLATLDISIVNVALPTLRTVLATDIAGLQWVVNAYAICLSAFMLSSGPLGDRYGHKKTWMTGVLLFACASGVCAMATSLPMLLAGRAIKGVAGALLIPGAMPILTHAFPDPRERASAIGGWAAFSALALILGPLLGGLLLQHAGWQSIFLINIPLGLLAAALGVYGIPERKHPATAALDPVGQLLSIFWLGALAYGLIKAGEGVGIPRSAATALALASVGFGLFLWVESRVARPLLPLSLFRHRPFTVANFASFTLGFSGYSSLFFFSLYLQTIQGHTPAETGWRMMPQFVVTGLASMLYGRVSAHFSPWGLMTVAFAFVGIALCSMVVFTTHTPYWVIAPLLCLLGLGMGLGIPSNGIVVMGTVPNERSGMASATMNALRQTGMTIGIALLGSLMSRQIAATLGSHSSTVKAASGTAASSVSPELYTLGLTRGFHLAIFLSGLTAFACSACLFYHRRHYAISAPAGNRPVSLSEAKQSALPLAVGTQAVSEV